jgi:hypothetical protein
MELRQLTSSNIAAAGFHPVEADTGHLRVQFTNGKHYDYYNVPKTVADELFDAESCGRYFNGFIRGQYEEALVDPETVPASQEVNTSPVDGLNGRASSDAGLQAGE